MCTSFLSIHLIHYFTNTGEGETTPGPHLLVMERTEVGIMAEVTVGVTGMSFTLDFPLQSCD
jgi:hypothetical protein